jgi:hypothetical protein
MKWKLFALLGAALLAFAITDNANADHFRRGCGGHGYGVGYNVGYGAPVYGYPSYGYGGGFYNRTDAFHYSRPRVTTGYGLRPYGYPGFGGRGFGYGPGFGRRGGVTIIGNFGRW